MAMHLLSLLLVAGLLTSCRPTELRVTLTDYEDHPIRNADIVLKRSGKTVMETRSDRSGYFRFEKLHPGDSIIISARNFRAETIVYNQTFAKHPEITFLLKRRD